MKAEVKEAMDRADSYVEMCRKGHTNFISSGDVRVLLAELRRLQEKK